MFVSGTPRGEQLPDPFSYATVGGGLALVTGLAYAFFGGLETLPLTLPSIGMGLDLMLSPNNEEDSRLLELFQETV
ncbi:MAG: hypothetical protein KDK48_04160 [Chlamydiia bacterium]|nr:hypothetical protein [Chlamydiia bacterium]